MPNWQLFYHLVWSTKERRSLITPDIEPIVHGFLRAKAIGLGATVFALNGTENHVHLVAAIPPSVAVATFIGKVKAVASAKFNKLGRSEVLYWQEEYGVFSFDGKRLPNYVHYVEQQKLHHAQGNVLPVLERTAPGAVLLTREPTPLYVTHSDRWWDELQQLAEPERSKPG